MASKRFLTTAHLDYSAESLEAFIGGIEIVIDGITKDKSIRFFLKFALNELVVNAMEHGYGENGGPVSVRILKNPDSILLEVSDNGKGIQPEALNLEHFVESHHDLNERGWGLSILKKISSDMIIKTNQPCGSIISITLPLAF